MAFSLSLPGRNRRVVSSAAHTTAATSSSLPPENGRSARSRLTWGRRSSSRLASFCSAQVDDFAVGLGPLVTNELRLPSPARIDFLRNVTRGPRPRFFPPAPPPAPSGRSRRRPPGPSAGPAGPAFLSFLLRRRRARCGRSSAALFRSLPHYRSHKFASTPSLSLSSASIEQARAPARTPWKTAIDSWTEELSQEEAAVIS